MNSVNKLWLYISHNREKEKIKCLMVMEGGKIRKNNHTILENTFLAHC